MGGGGRGSIFFHKKGGIGTLGGVILKKGGITYFHTIPFQCHFSQSVWYVCVLFIYTTSISIICVSEKDPSLLQASNQQMWL